MKVLGSRALGARLHQWHAGMDAVYAAGSTFFARGEANSKTVEDALWILRRERKNVTGASLRSLNATIRALETALERAKRKASRLRAPGAKGRRLASSSRASAAASRQHRARKANPGARGRQVVRLTAHSSVEVSSRGEPRWLYYVAPKGGRDEASFSRALDVFGQRFPGFSHGRMEPGWTEPDGRTGYLAAVTRVRNSNPRDLLSRHLSHGFYRITDAQAGSLARAVGKPLPGHGRELRVEVPGVGLRWLTRTPYSPNNWTDAPARGWVWAIH